MPEIVPIFCASPSEVAVLFNWYLSRRPFSRSSHRLDLLPAQASVSDHADLFLCLIFAQKHMNVGKIERSNECGFGWHQVLAKSFEISFHLKFVFSIVIRYGPEFTKLYNLSTLELGQYHKNGSTFSSSEPVAALGDCCRQLNALCLYLPVLPAQAVLERSLKSLDINFALKTLNCLLEQSSEKIDR